MGRVCTDHTESTQGLKEGKEEVRVRRGNRGPKSAHLLNQVQGQGQAQAPRPPHTVESSWWEEPGPVLSFTSFLSTGCITMSLIGVGGECRLSGVTVCLWPPASGNRKQPLHKMTALGSARPLPDPATEVISGPPFAFGKKLHTQYMPSYDPSFPRSYTAFPGKSR